MRLKQVAVYTPSAGAKARRDIKHQHHSRLHHQLRASSKERKRDHGHGFVERAVGDIVSATINGQLVSWTNEYAGPGVTTAAPNPVSGSNDESSGSSSNAAQPVQPSSAIQQVSSATAPPIEISSTTQQVSTAAAAPPSAAPTATVPESRLTSNGGWARQAYYNAAGSTSEGLTFLNHFGGTNGIPGTAAGGPP